MLLSIGNSCVFLPEIYASPVPRYGGRFGSFPVPMFFHSGMGSFGVEIDGARKEIALPRHGLFGTI